MSARSLFYSKDKKFSNADEKAFAREEIVYNVTEDILVILENSGISKKELARRLGRSGSFVTQILSGVRNMTLGTLSDICFVLGKKPKVTMKEVSETLSRKGWDKLSTGLELPLTLPYPFEHVTQNKKVLRTPPTMNGTWMHQSDRKAA